MKKASLVIAVCGAVCTAAALPGEARADGFRRFIAGGLEALIGFRPRAGGSASAAPSIQPSELKNTYYLLRHGESTGNVKGVISCGLPALFGHGLTALGLTQAQVAGERSPLPEDTLIISSPLKRARQTAKLFRRAAGISGAVALDWNLRERGFGTLNGSLYADYDRVREADVLRQQQGVIGPNDEPSLEARGVESFASVQGRTAGLIADLERRYQGRTILLVAHDNTAKALFTLLPAAHALSHRALKISNGQIYPLSEASLRQVMKGN